MSESVTNHPYGGGIVLPGAVVWSGARVESGAVVGSGAVVWSGARVVSGAVVESGAVVWSGARVESGAVVESGARVESGAVVGSGAVVWSGARVVSKSNVIVCGPIGSRGARLTAYWCVTPEGEGVEFVTGCFVGTGEQLMAEAELTHGIGSRHAEDYAAAVKLMTRLVLASVPPETGRASGRGE